MLFISYAFIGGLLIWMVTDLVRGVRRHDSSRCSSWNLTPDGVFHAVTSSGPVMFEPGSLTAVHYHAGSLYLVGKGRRIFVTPSDAAATKELLDRLQVIHPGARLEYHGTE